MSIRHKSIAFKALNLKPKTSFLSAILFVSLAMGLTACVAGTVPKGGGTGSTPAGISVPPVNVTVNAGQSATFSVTASGTPPFTYQWFNNGADAGTNASTYVIALATTQDTGAQIKVQVSNSLGSATSNPVTLTVNANVVPVGNATVLTFHNDVARTGQNLNETILTPANVNSTSFGKIGFLTLDGQVVAEPLYVSSLTVSGAAHNVVFVVTEHGSAYAFDADSLGAPLWKVSAIGAGETSSDDRNCSEVSPEIGITATPVIDLHAGAHGVMYLVAMSKDANGDYFQRLHALDITTGAEISGSPTTIQATYPNQSGTTTFDPKQYKERAALLLLNGVIYTTWASHCDTGPYTGWIIGYNENTLQQSGVLNVIPNGGEGAIWMAGDGPAADSAGNFYFLDANGTFDNTLNTNGFPVSGDYGNAFIKISTSGNNLSVGDYFTMFNTTSESNSDQDLGSGGEILLPDLQDGNGNTWQLGVGAGKDGHIYVVNRNMMGKFNTSNDNAIYQEISTNGLGGGVWSTPAYFNNTVYYGAVGDSLRAFAIVNAKLVAPAGSQSSADFAYPGTTPSISANGTAAGIVWAVENHDTGVLHAYDATNLGNELYNSSQAANGRDSFSDNKFITPMIANGKVFVGTPTGVAVFGILP
ncbi:MAG: pyrrolo-quinoline quinone [Candidatus Acidiferrales bacterium]